MSMFCQGCRDAWITKQLYFMFLVPLFPNRNFPCTRCEGSYNKMCVILFLPLLCATYDASCANPLFRIMLQSVNCLILLFRAADNIVRHDLLYHSVIHNSALFSFRFCTVHILLNKIYIHENFVFALNIW